MNRSLTIFGISILLYSCCPPTLDQNPNAEPMEPHDASIVAGAPIMTEETPPSASTPAPANPNRTFTFTLKEPGPEWYRIPFSSLASFENSDGDQIHLTADEAKSLAEAIRAIDPILKHPEPKYKSEWRVNDGQNIAECDIGWRHNSAKIVIRFFPKANVALVGIAASETLPGLQKAGFLTRNIVRSAEIRPATPEEENPPKDETPPESTYL